jgi:hypothetical protein
LPALTCGIASWANAQLRINVRLFNAQPALSMIAEMTANRQGKPYRLPAGETFRLQPVCLVWGDSVDRSVQGYMSILGERLESPSRPAHGGIFSGYGMSARATRGERIGDAAYIESMIEAAKRFGMNHYGLSVFKTQFSRFSTGTKTSHPPKRPSVWPAMETDKLADHILEHGFVPDYDLADRAPQGVAAITEKIDKSGYLPAFDSRPYLNFDATDEGNDLRVAQIYRGIVEKWGYRYLMLDFISSDFESDNDSRTMSQAIRDRFKAIRNAVGPEIFIEACMCSIGPVLGVADGFRPAEDWRPGLERIIASELASRYFYHNRVVVQDMEFVDVSIRPACWDDWDNRAFHSLTRVRTMTALSAIAGFSTLVGGFLDEISEERWKIFTRCLPVEGSSGVPLDYPENDPPAIWYKQRVIAGENIDVLAVFNWDEHHNTTISIPLARLRSRAVASRLCIFEFWSQRATFISTDGPSNDEYSVNLNPGESKVLFINDLKYGEHPRYVGCDRHIMGDPGSLRLAYDFKERALSGGLELIGDGMVRLYFSLPAGLSPDLEKAQRCRPELVEAQLIRVDIEGEPGTSLDWYLPFTEEYYVF